MICFEVKVIGQHACLAGMDQTRQPVSMAATVAIEGDDPSCKEEMFLHVAGVTLHGKNNLFLDWLKRRPISVGDEISIRIVERDQCDVVESSRCQAPEAAEEEDRQIYKQMKQALESRSQPVETGG